MVFTKKFFASKIVITINMVEKESNSIIMQFISLILILRKLVGYICIILIRKV